MREQPLYSLSESTSEIVQAGLAEDLLRVEIETAGYSGNKAIIKDICFSLRRGELLGLIGPNGAGKSTTIKAILGLLPELKGKVNFFGIKPSYIYIPEQPILYDGLTLWEHLEFAAAVYELDRQEFLNRAEHLLNVYRLEDYRHQLPETFSKGMQQKVMLILGFLIDPDIYVVDEPFIGLDPRAVKEFLAMLNEARKRGAAVLMSTHVLDTAEKICDSFLLMAGGKLVAQGNLDMIRAQSQLSGGSLFDCFDLMLERNG